MEKKRRHEKEKDEMIGLHLHTTCSFDAKITVAPVALRLAAHKRNQGRAQLSRITALSYLKNARLRAW